VRLYVTIFGIQECWSLPMIVVTTPTGKIGRHVVRHLLASGEALRLIVRDAASCRRRFALAWR
jgi:uncharacterized protein YbjT (DUF2867 family)